MSREHRVHRRTGTIESCPRATIHPIRAQRSFHSRVRRPIGHCPPTARTRVPFDRASVISTDPPLQFSIRTSVVFSSFSFHLLISLLIRISYVMLRFLSLSQGHEVFLSQRIYSVHRDRFSTLADGVRVTTIEQQHHASVSLTTPGCVQLFYFSSFKNKNQVELQS